VKLLIVDDNDVRLARIIEHLLQRSNIARDDIHTATSGQDARHLLGRYHYDLLVIDLVLRRRPESAPEAQTSLDLLVELTETEKLHRPRQIIGITAYVEAEQTAINEFERYAWRVLSTDDVGNNYLQVLGSSVRYLIGREADPTPTPSSVDLLVVSALETEMAAFKRGWEWSADEPFDENTYHARGKFESKGRRFSAVAATAPRMGMVSAAVLTAKLAHALRPRMILMPGICAGVAGRTQLGDVIFADACWDYQSGKHSRDGDKPSDFAFDPHFVNADGALSAHWDHLSRDHRAIQELALSWQLERRPPPTLRRGPIGSGSAVLADENIVKDVMKQHRKTLAIEMELYGVFCAAASASWPRPLVCGIKAVCDFADAKKDDNAQPFAAHMSGAVSRAFMERYMADLCP
jgi:nucleoside phosphorylase/CheY-like chemotaxis protein